MLDPYDSDPNSAKSFYLRSSYPKSSVGIGSQHYHFLPIRRDQVPHPSQLHLHHDPAKQAVIGSPRISTSQPTPPSHQTHVHQSPSPSPSSPRSAPPRRIIHPSPSEPTNAMTLTIGVTLAALPFPAPLVHRATTPSVAVTYVGRWKRDHRTRRTCPRKWQPARWSREGGFGRGCGGGWWEW